MYELKCISILSIGDEKWQDEQKMLKEFGMNKKLNGKQLTTSLIANKSGSSPTLYGKLNFKNQANKDVKIYEVSGIGEPTVLSPNYVSTFFVKSSKPSATFKAEDPSTHQAYLMNGKNLFKVDLSQNPSTEDDVLITEDASTRRTSDEPSMYT